MFYFLGGLVLGAILGFLADMFLLRGRYEAEAEALRQQLNESRDKTRSLQRDVDTHIATTKTLQARLDTSQQKLGAMQGDLEGRSAERSSMRAELSNLQAQRDSHAEAAIGLNQQITSAQAEVAGLQARLAALEGENGRLRTQMTDCEAVRQQLNAAEIELAEIRARLANATVEPGEPDDLQRLEGIGPKISAVLNAAGIYTFRRLAATPIDRLHEILRAGGISRISDPSTWGEQATLAAAGDWEGLQALQDTLKGGRRA